MTSRAALLSVATEREWEVMLHDILRADGRRNHMRHELMAADHLAKHLLAMGYRKVFRGKSRRARAASGDAGKVEG